MTTHEIPIIVSSSTAAGAINKSADGSSFEIFLEDPLQIPRNVSSVTVEVQEATVWWVIPNISAALGNNKFYILHLGVNYVITIPDGLYELTDLNTTLNRQLQTATTFSGLVTLTADNPTQKVNITINQAGTQLNFMPADTFRDIIGFNSQLIPSGGITTGVFNQLGDNVAAFNTIDYFLIHSDIIIRGIRVNNIYSQTIAQVLIDQPPGSQIISRPFNPPVSGAWELSGSIRNRLRFWLTDQANNLVNTNNENWSARIIIKYTESVADQLNVNNGDNGDDR